jgi:hypothetical protein
VIFCFGVVVSLSLFNWVGVASCCWIFSLFSSDSDVWLLTKSSCDFLFFLWGKGDKIQQQEATPTQLKSDKETTTPKQKITEDDKKNIKDTETPPIQAPQQDSTLANNHTPNEENKGEATSQRGPPTDKELPQLLRAILTG